MSEHAYRTNDPAAVAAYHAAVAARAKFTIRIREAIAQLGYGRLEPMSCPGGYGDPETILGLRYETRDRVPFGWRVRNRRSPGHPDILIEPAPTGVGSTAAKRWLAEHQPGPECDPAYVLKKHGIAYHSRQGTISAYTVHFPILFAHAGYVWVWYEQGVPSGDFPGDTVEITWEPVPLAELLAARDAAIAEHN